MQMGGSQGMDMGGWGRKYHIYGSLTVENIRNIL